METGGAPRDSTLWNSFMPSRVSSVASHPSHYRAATSSAPAKSAKRITIPLEGDATIQIGGKDVPLTNLSKFFWTNEKLTKANLLQYYADVAPVLLPYIESRAMVLKRYPDGASGEFFFQKHAPKSKPNWVPVCEIQHPSANLVDFPVVNDAATLLWIVNLGCIDLNPWYARC